MEAKASKHASKRVHACARARARARGLMAALRCPAGAPPRMGANSALMRAASPKSKPAAASPASAASWSSPHARYARDIRFRRRAPASAAVQPQRAAAEEGNVGGSRLLGDNSRNRIKVQPTTGRAASPACCPRARASCDEGLRRRRRTSLRINLLSAVSPSLALFRVRLRVRLRVCLGLGSIGLG